MLLYCYPCSIILIKPWGLQCFPLCFATVTTSSGDTSFFPYCLHTKPWGLLCFPLYFATGNISSGNTSFLSYCLHPKPWGLCNWDYLFWKHKILLLLSTQQTLGCVDFAIGTISSGNTSFFSYCLHTKPWGLLCFPCFATGIISSGNTSFFSYCLHTKPWGLLWFPL